MNAPVRVVHDTNVVVSTLVLASPRMLEFLRLWTSGQVLPLANRRTTRELVRVLDYPKFRLEPAEQKDVLARYSLLCEMVPTSKAPAVPAVRDAADRPFLELALVGRADALVSGDAHLLDLAPEFPIPILKPGPFREWLRKRQGQERATRP